MARTKKKAATADEFNAEQEELRQEAREADTNVVDLGFPTLNEIEADKVYIRDLALEIGDYKARRKGCNDEITAKLTEAETNGLSRDALKAAIKLEAMEPAKRKAWMETLRRCARAFGWDAQRDLFEAAEPGSIPGLERPFIGGEQTTEEPGVDAGVAKAIEEGWLTEDELKRNAEFAAEQATH